MKKQKFFILILTILALSYLGIRFLFNRVENEARSYIGNFKPDVSKLEDGRYKGHFGFFHNRIEASVEFIIENHNLAGCNFVKLFGTPGHKAPYQVKQRIDQDNNLDFEAVSGATMTSQLARAAIKKAIENGRINTEN